VVWAGVAVLLVAGYVAMDASKGLIHAIATMPCADKLCEKSRETLMLTTLRQALPWWVWIGLWTVAGGMVLDLVTGPQSWIAGWIWAKPQGTAR
jgi:hypothetical protein